MGAKPTVLVAGATGYLGRFLAQSFHDHGYRVRALVRDRRRADALVADELFEGQATRPDSLHGAMDDVTWVVSSLGITRQRDGLSYDEVDYGANLNLLHLAEAAGTVERFGYVSVFRGPELRDATRLVAAKERFVEALRGSTLQSVVVRPTGFFSDMEEFLDMARRGRVYVFGDGSTRLNPIHGADLASEIVAAMERGTGDLPIGGPEVLSMRRIAELAFLAAGRRERIAGVPDWMRRFALAVLPRVTPLHVYGPAQFFLAASALDMVAPAYGERHLADHFRSVAARG